jgi:hypothetical protein
MTMTKYGPDQPCQRSTCEDRPPHKGGRHLDPRDELYDGPTSTLRALPSLGEECVIHTRMVVREDAMLLFGFATKEERSAFDALTGVSKVGPKLALAHDHAGVDDALLTERGESPLRRKGGRSPITDAADVENDALRVLLDQCSAEPVYHGLIIAHKLLFPHPHLPRHPG